VAIPANAHTSKYADTNIQVKANASSGWCLALCSLWKARNMGAVAGNIMASIMTTHVARNSVAYRPVADDVVGMSIFIGAQTKTAHAAAARIKSKINMMLR
jgi:hypothetical protein